MHIPDRLSPSRDLLAMHARSPDRSLSGAPRPAGGVRAASDNRLIAGLSPDDQAKLRPHLELVRLSQKDVLFDANRPISHVYFPETCVVSLVTSLREGGTVEVGTVGREGMAGLPVFLNNDVSPSRAIVQIPGDAWRLAADKLPIVAPPGDALHRLLLRYTHGFLVQVSQTAACNSAHLVEQRCARWLLMTRDRVDAEDFPLTHEFLAFMLGVRRSGVTIAMRGLKDAGLILYTRGRVRIVDPERLQQASCECYGIVRSHFDRMAMH